MFTTQPSKSAERLAEKSSEDRPEVSPLLWVQPTLIDKIGGRGAAWTVDEVGQQLALGFIHFGFRVRRDTDNYWLPLDAETDILFLRLYDLIASLRWRAPQRQLHLLEALLPLSQEVCDG